MTSVVALPFTTTLILALVVLAGIGLTLLLKWRDYRSSRLSMPAAFEPQDRDKWERLLLPLTCYEDQYPTFVGILAASALRVPLDRLLKTADLAGALGYLSQNGLIDSELSKVEFAMLEVVHALLSHPEVEYTCRDIFTAARLDQFLAELKGRHS